MEVLDDIGDAIGLEGGRPEVSSLLREIEERELSSQGKLSSLSLGQGLLKSDVFFASTDSSASPPLLPPSMPTSPTGDSFRPQSPFSSQLVRTPLHAHPSPHIYNLNTPLLGVTLCVVTVSHASWLCPLPLGVCSHSAVPLSTVGGILRAHGNDIQHSVHSQPARIPTGDPILFGMLTTLCLRLRVPMCPFS